MNQKARLATTALVVPNRSHVCGSRKYREFEMSDNESGSMNPNYISPPMDHEIRPGRTATDVAKQWAAGREYIEANLDIATVEDKQRFNVWDKLATVTDVVAKSLSGEWLWWRNSRCKYINVRIDMRSGNCIITDNDGKRIGPAELRHQFGTE